MQVLRDDVTPIVSDTGSVVEHLTPAAGLAAAAVADAQQTFLSLPPGSLTVGVMASIQNRRTLALVEAEIIDGGFDPVGLEARAGDEIETRVVGQGGETLQSVVSVVPSSKRPAIVRTIPPRKKKDVPLNLRIGVVFSEPLDPALPPAALRLMRGATAVAGRVEMRDLQGLSLDFVPDAPLSAATTYQLIVSQDIRDRDGEYVGASDPVAFTTGNTVSAPAAINIAMDTLWAVTTPYDFVDILAIITDSDGNELRQPLFVGWLSNNPGTVSLADGHFSESSGRNAVRLYAHDTSGAATITASLGGATDKLVVVLHRPIRTHVTVAQGQSGGGCFLTQDRDAYCSGSNTSGEVGSPVGWTQFPVRVAGGLKFTSISAGVKHVCAVDVDAAAWCWGGNSRGQVGSSNRTVYSPARVPGGLSFRQVTAGAMHSCGITQSGATYCWGTQYGPASEGPGDSPWSPTPVQISTVAPLTQIDAGYRHTCGVTATGAAYCWGENDGGQLGNGTVSSSASPVAVAGGLSFAQVSAGPSHTCGVTTDGAVFCWGTESGPGNGGYEAFLPVSTAPQRVALPAGIALSSVDVGNGPTCGVATNGEVYCWGFVWDGDRGDTSVPPTRVPSNLSFVSVSSGLGPSCAISTEPAEYCWGLMFDPPAIGVFGKAYGQR